MQFFWKKSGDVIVITEKRPLLRHSNSDSHARIRFSQNTILCKFGTYYAFKKKIVHQKALRLFVLHKLKFS